MKKLFTIVIFALVAVSVWSGTSFQIGDVTSSKSEFVPIGGTNSSYYSISQLIYLASELTTAGATAGNIESISFYYCGSTEKTRTIDVWINSTTTPTSFTKDSFYYISDNPENYKPGTLYAENASAELPATEGWYTITFNTKFAWDGTSNIILTINDKSDDHIASFSRYHKTYTATTNRAIYTSKNSGSAYDAINCHNLPSGTRTTAMPIIKFTFEGGDEPEPDPTITVSETDLDFGSYYPAAETVSKTFKVTASNLTEDITLATTANGVTINPTSISKDNAELAGEGVEVTVTLGSGYKFPYINPKVSVTSTTSKNVTLKATEVRDTDFSTKALNFVSSNGYYIVDGNVTIQSINTTNKSMVIKATTTKNANYTLIDGQATFAVGGIFNGLKGKYEDEVFKIFSYGSYSGPAKPTIVMEENSNNSTEILAIEDGTEMGSVTIKRTFATNQWNTLCVPILLGSGDIETYFGSGTQVMAFDEANISPSSITLNFKSASQIQAGEPYLIKPTKEVSSSIVLQNRDFYKTVTPVDHDGISFEGVLVPTEIDGGDGSDYIIVGANNTLLHPTGTGTINGMRAYFHVVGSAAKAALKTAKVSMNTGSTTELVLIKDNQVKPYKTMVNDQIVIVNEGKQINILGQTVK